MIKRELPMNDERYGRWMVRAIDWSEWVIDDE